MTGVFFDIKTRDILEATWLVFKQLFWPIIWSIIKVLWPLLLFLILLKIGFLKKFPRFVVYIIFVILIVWFLNYLWTH